MYIVMGVDPGMASTGIAILKGESLDDCRLIHGEVITTKPPTKKDRQTIRVSTHDTYRINDIFTRFNELMVEYYPSVIAIESYAVFQGRGGNAWKSAMVYGAFIALGLDRNLMTIISTPGDVKKAMCGKANVTKAEVQKAVSGLIKGAGSLLKVLPKGKQEHLADAAGHAYIGLGELLRVKSALGES